MVSNGYSNGYKNAYTNVYNNVIKIVKITIKKLVSTIVTSTMVQKSKYGIMFLIFELKTLIKIRVNFTIDWKGSL